MVSAMEENNADMKDSARTHAHVYTGRSLSLLLKLGPKSGQEMSLG